MSDENKNNYTARKFSTETSATKPMNNNLMVKTNCNTTNNTTVNKSSETKRKE